MVSLSRGNVKIKSKRKYNMINSIKLLKCYRLHCLFLWYCSVAFVLVKGQTNLFRGYKTGKNSGIDGIIDDVPLTTTLSNGIVFPLVGLGVGNLQRNLVETMIYHGLNDDRRIRLVDTAHASGNEREVARGITTGIKDLKEQLAVKKDNSNRNGSKQRIQVHVVTKIWYTYLGYERTKLAIDEILQSFEEAIKDPNVDLKVTLLLHWSQCFDEIPWMNCEEEEQQLPDRIKNAGPPPHLDKANAWKGSWRALEEAYENRHSADNNKNKNDESVVASIGISNFNFRTLQTLLDTCTTAPHLAQINVWSLMNETPIIELMNENNIHLQVYNAMNGIIGQVYQNPKAHHHILMVANQLKKQSMDMSSSDSENDGVVVEKVFFAQVILKWLVQFGISVIPRTSNPEHLAENSAVSLSNIPAMSQEQIETAGKSMAAILNNEDLKNDVLVQVRFHAKESDMFLYWVPEEGDNERQLAFIEKGRSYEESTHPGHTFKVYHAYDPDQFETYSIRGHYGESQDIHVEL
jgi:diketogulonate reductase-like aldo/keto reductase